MRSLRSLLSPAKGAKSVDPESQATTLNSSETPTVVQAENEKTDEKTAPFEATRSADDSGHEKAVSNLATKSEKEEERGNGDDDEDREYPRGLPLVIVSAGLCLAVLLVALVSRSCISSFPFLTDLGLMLELGVGQHHHRHCYSPHHGSVPVPRFCRMVCVGLSFDGLLVPTHLREALYFLPNQMGVFDGHHYLRGRFSCLRCSA